MKFPHFFIERPIFAAVLSILIVIVGAIAYPSLPIAQYPNIAPPTVVVTATYPGASAETLAETVAAPIEQAINGVDNMMYMTSSSTGNGQTQITIAFKQGTNVDQAQVLVQNRVQQAEPRLPEDVRRLGITVNKNSPDFLMVVFFTSPDNSLDIQYISNYVTLQVQDRIARIPGVGQALAFGGRDYNMRLWIDPGLAAARDMTIDEVVNAVRGQNVQVAAGSVGQPPYGNASPAFELGVQAKGRLTTPDEFGSIVIKRDAEGKLTHLRDVARIELGAQDYSFNGYLNDKRAVGVSVFQLPGSNALATAEAVKAELETLSKQFPQGMKYSIDYNPTEYIDESITAVEHTLIEALVLVVLVVIIFLQSWRAAIIPIIAIPVSLVGAFAVLLIFGYSLNTLSLFGLVLAIGIVVDDAIVVVENVERLMEEKGLSPREAAHETMDEVSGAIIAISLVLVGVFIPTMFIPGISGAFYQQFAITIASATIISAFVSLTLSPALCALVLKHKGHHSEIPEGWRGLPARAGLKFNQGFNWLSEKYGQLTSKLVRMLMVVGVVYVALILVAGWRFTSTPSGFIPPQDQGYLIGVVSLPPGSSLQRTDAVVREAIAAANKVPGMLYSVGFAGLDGASFSTAPNAGVIFLGFKPHADRKETQEEIQGALYGAFSGIKGGTLFIVPPPPPPVPGIGNGGGFKMMVQDRSGQGYHALAGAAMGMMMGANQQESVTNTFTQFNTGTPRLTADVDRERAERMGVPVQNIFSTLGSYLGSAYVNDFNYLGRTFRVTAQADAPYRDDASDIQMLKTRSAAGEMVPMSSVMTLKNDSGPYRVVRYNLYPAAELIGDTKPGYSTGQTLDSMEALAAQTLPRGMGFEWTELALEQRQAGNTGLIAFGLAVVFVFLLLAALYESVVLPLAVILIVPMCLLAAILGVNLMGMDNNILTQIGLIVLIGLAAKNAILIVEFARQNEEEGMDMWEAAKHAAHQRMRPIVMTSIAFILGVLPLVIASGAAAELRQALGVAVFFGMIGVTIFGLLFTPAFYVICRKLGDWASSTAARLRRKPTHDPKDPVVEPAE